MPLTINHAVSVNTAIFPDWATNSTVVVANSTGGTYAVSASDMVQPSEWNQTHSAQFQLTGSEIASLFSAEHRITMTTGAGGITFGLDNQVAFFEPALLYNVTMTSISNAIWYFDPIQIPGALNSGQIRQVLQLGSSNVTTTAPVAIFAFPVSTISATSSGNCTKAGTFYNRVALFLRGTHSSETSNHSDSLYRQWSNEDQYIFSYSMSVGASASSGSNFSFTYNQYYTYPTQWNSSGGVVTLASSAQYSTTFAGSQIPITSFTSIASIASMRNIFSGGIIIPIGLNTRISAGEWYLAVNHQVSTQSGVTAGYSIGGMISSAGISKMVATEYASMSLFKSINATISNTTSQYFPGHGFYSSSVSTCPANIPITDIRVTNSMFRQYWNYNNYTN